MFAHALDDRLGAADAGADGVEFHVHLLGYLLVLHALYQALARDFAVQGRQFFDISLGLLPVLSLDDGLKRRSHLVRQRVHHHGLFVEIIYGYHLVVHAVLLLEQVESSVPCNGPEPGDELALGRVVRSDLAESLLETPAADVVDVQVVEVLEPFLDEGSQRIDMQVPQGRECGPVACYCLADQVINVTRAS